MNALAFTDIAIGVLILEAVILLIWRRRSGGLLPPSRVLAMCGAGLALLAALHAQAVGFGLPMVALALACAGVCHAADLAQRLKDRPAL